MAAPIIYFDPKGIRATYTTSDQTLRVNAEGAFPYAALSPNFEQVTWLGGRKLKLVSFFGGFRRNEDDPDQKWLRITWAEKITGPIRFQDVIVVTAPLGGGKDISTPIKIVFDPAPPSEPVLPPMVPLKAQPIQATSTQIDQSTVFLTPISVSLPARNFVRITTPTPDPSLFSYTVDARSDPDALYVWRAGQSRKYLYWDLAWQNTSSAASGQKFTFTVTTSTKSPSDDGPTLPKQITAQPYAVARATGSNL